MIYLHVFFFVPPRAPWRAFRNHVIKSTASPTKQKTINRNRKIDCRGAGGTAAGLFTEERPNDTDLQCKSMKQNTSFKFWMIKSSTTVLAKKSMSLLILAENQHIAFPRSAVYKLVQCRSLWTLQQTLLGNLEVLLAAKHHSLQHLMGRHMGLEVSRIPEFTHKLPKPLHQKDHDVARWPADSLVVFLLQEVVPQRWNIGKSLKRRGYQLVVKLYYLKFNNQVQIRSTFEEIYTCNTTLA